MAPASPLDATAVAQTVSRVRDAVGHVIRGKDDVVEKAVVSVVAGGHILLEDIPGVGKTTLARALAGALGGAFRRIQFTADLLPGDITGVTVLSEGALSFRPGPIFANVVLADEINRAMPRTQSALLEAMGERQVTIDGHSHPLPSLFVVITTQNPHDQHGTFPLPDAQLDRFLMRLSMGYPSPAHEREILRRGPVAMDAPTAVSPEDVGQLAAQVQQVSVHEEVEAYLLELVGKTRSDDRLIRGVSTRGAAALYHAARALALVRGRHFVIPEDVRELAVPVLAHRLQPRRVGFGERDGAVAAVEALLWELTPPV